jgi:hypothetical protein
MFRSFLLILLGVTVCSSKIYNANSASQIKSTLLLLKAGDTMIVADGKYSPGYLTITSVGTKSMPVVIKAANIGKAELTGTGGITLKSASDVVIEGFLFTVSATAVKMTSCTRVRVTRNTFRLNESTSLKWVYIGGPNSSYNRVDYNLFEEKHQLGNFITIDGDSEIKMLSSQHDLISFNHFRNVGPRATNEMEAIRVGSSEISLSNGYTVIEYNLFENCDGDPEIVSLKTCKDTVRYNTVLSSQGCISSRHGNGNVLYGNYFFGKGKSGTGGIRIYGRDHIICNNYFEGLTGKGYDAPLQIDGGDVDTTGALSSHFRVYRAVVAFNTFVNNVYGIEVATNYSKVHVDCKFAYNIITGTTNKLVTLTKTPQNMQWISNVADPEGTATLGTSFTDLQFKIADLKFTLRNSLMRPANTSLIVNAGSTIISFCIDDLDGQIRDSKPDIGADEISTLKIVRGPLTSLNVGPFAKARDDGSTSLINQNILKQNFRGNSVQFKISFKKKGQQVQPLLFQQNSGKYFNLLGKGVKGQLLLPQ